MNSVASGPLNAPLGVADRACTAPSVIHVYSTLEPLSAIAARWGPSEAPTIVDAVCTVPTGVQSACATTVRISTVGAVTCHAIAKSPDDSGETVATSA